MKYGDLYHKRLNDFEPFDEITIQSNCRYKTSGLSGDEWRVGVVVRFYFKGIQMHEKHLSTMEFAVRLLDAEYITTLENGLSSSLLSLEDRKCDQPSCRNDAVNRFKLKRQTAPNGNWLDMSEIRFTYYRKFCAEHSKRGNQSREDCDDNYELLAEVPK